MSLHLDHATIQKLTHNSPEIRVRTLEQIWNKMNRANEHNEKLHFKAGELCKQLIRWFEFEPLSATQRVLQLLLLILRSNEKSIRQLGVERFKREMDKIRLLLRKRPSESQIVDEIMYILKEYQYNQLEDKIDDVTEIFDSLSVAKDEGSHSRNKDLLIHFEPIDYEPAWSIPTPADFTTLTFMTDLLSSTDVEKVEAANVLLHLEITMLDYPAEYMLQSPHVFLNLMHLYRFYDDIEINSLLEDVARTINAYLRLLLKRIKTRNNVTAYSVKTSKFGNTQLKVGTILRFAIEKSIHILEVTITEFSKETRQIVEIVTNCLELYRIQQLTIGTNVLMRLNKIIASLQVCFEQDEHFTLQRIKYLLLVCLLDDIMQHNMKMGSCKGIPQVLEFLLCDFSFKENFPNRYKNIQQRYLNAVGGSKRLRELDGVIRTTVTLLKNPQAIVSADIIENGLDIFEGLENLKNIQLAELTFNAIVNCNAHYISQPNLRAKADELLLRLLHLTHEPLRLHIFKMLAMSVKRHFAALMECECYSMGLTHGQLLEAQVLGVPLSGELLLNLIYECTEGAHESIRKISQDVLVFILKSQKLLGEHWTKLLELLLPVLPLLQCCTNSPQIIELLQNLLDPDAKQLPFLAVLKGSIGFMFHRDSAVRSEALTRLIYIMNSVPDADKYIPNLLYISDVIPNDLCILKTPREYTRIFINVTDFCERDTLLNLLSILEMSDVEPVVRKTTLMQLNVMCQQWHTLSAFCEESAHYLILRALENSMVVESCEDYTGAAVPAIGVLCKVLLYDTGLRCELSDTPNIYVLLLRALCLYQNEIQMRQDACICLFLLLYANYVVVLGNQRIEAPKSLGNLQIPLSCELQAIKKRDMSLHHYDGTFKSKLEENSYIRQLLAFNFCNQQLPIPKQYLEKQKSYNLDVGLHLTLRDWRLMNATIPKQNIHRFLRAILNATSHNSLINACVSLQLQLMVRDQHSTAGALMPDEVADELYSIIGKYLQLSPGNETDYELFEELLDLCDFCVRLSIPIICTRLLKELIADFQHAMISLLKVSATPLRLNHKLCSLLGKVIAAVKPVKHADEGICIFNSNLFELIFQLIMQYFQKRDLLRIRSLLDLQKILSAYDINVSDEQLVSYCKHFIKLSLALKSFTQTGAQWQIDCLTIVCQLYGQMREAETSFKLSESTLKYLSGLCGHCDQAVRALAWCILTYVSHFNSQQDTKSSLAKGVDLLQNTLFYLPGGFMACCLCTFLDVGETIGVRQLAANLFTKLLSDKDKFEDANVLLTRHRFLEFASEAVRGCCVFGQQLPPHIDANSGISIANCGLIGFLCRICLRMLQLNGDFATVLCASNFLTRLYELLKISPEHSNPAYYTMCGDICHLYGACYPSNFSFLQRILCRDQVWLISFYQLLDQPLESDVVVNILQLLLVICKDDLAFEKLCRNIAKAPEFLVRNFLRAFTINNLNTPLQRCSLAALSLLLIKSHNRRQMHDEQKTFLTVLEDDIEIKDPTFAKDNHITGKSASINEMVNGKKSNSSSDNLSACDSLFRIVTKSAAAFIFVQLFLLFQHLYTRAACKFDVAPSKTQVQVSETLGVLLSLSPEARLAAKGLKLFDKMSQIFNTFFEQFKCSATTYVRRYGENKKLALIKNLQLLLSVHSHWFAAPDAALTDNLQSITLSKLTMQLWPFLAHSCELKQLVLQVCSFHSEHSFIVSQQFSVLFSGYAHSLLQLVIKLVIAETTRVKASTTESFPVISTGLRVVMNCCSCAEGRVTIIKAHMLDIFDSLHPFHLKSPQVKMEVLRAWLQFWELFSRYPEGAQTRNLRALCDVILRAPAGSATRVLTLRILRNMCFLPNNRSAFMTSSDFVCTVDAIVAQPLDLASTPNGIPQCASYEEQLIVCVGVWKLASAGAKYVAQLRSTNLAKHLRRLHEQLVTLKENDSKKISQLPFANDLSYVLDVILNIFNN
ncbi:uncharacterized protein LOC118753364 [Rhagoletis pomonella]|uniref:uncharacterized protein LOC118753364 n=1 Tax=Rhagoletis pomonella TaxID=28610 RepID=UPI00178241A0|nr:uncharacterized protein LOC118753364 [Rhagoletis pomonella]